MKNLLFYLVIVSVILTYSCEKNKQETVVKINSDGTCYREFIRTSGDSAFMFGDTSKNPFPMKLDSGWKITWKYSSSKHAGTSGTWPVKTWAWDKDTSKHLSLTLVAHKDYASVDSMAKSFRYDRSEWAEVTPKISFEKKFRFFFTFFEYKETYLKYNPLKLVPVDKYLTNDEIQMMYTDNPKFAPELNGKEIYEILKGIDNQSEEWQKRSYFEEIYRILPKYLPNLKLKDVDSSAIALAKDSIYKLLDKDELKDFTKALNHYFKTREFSRLDSCKEFEKETEGIISKVENPFNMTISYHLLMPGKILHTTSKKIHGDTLTWKLEPYRFFFTDYEIKAESRVANIWAFVVSGIFLIIVAASFFIKRR